MAARPIAEGNTSLDDWDAFTWSFGCTARPSVCAARDAMTSLAFMLLEVPEPVWNTSTGNASSCSPRATEAAAAWIASAMSASSTPSSPLTLAATPLMQPSAPIMSRPSRSPDTGKFSTARWVCAPHSAPAGTSTSPIESRSIRVPGALMDARRC